MSPLHFDEVAIELCDRLFPIKIDNSFARAQGLLNPYLKPVILVTDVGDKKFYEQNYIVTNLTILTKIQGCFNNHKDLVALEKEAALKKVSSGTQVDFRIISCLLIGWDDHTPDRPMKEQYGSHKRHRFMNVAVGLYEGIKFQQD